MNENEEVNQVEHGRAGQMKLELKDQLVKRTIRVKLFEVELQCKQG